MAGSGSRFVDAGYTKPKPFIDVLVEAMISDRKKIRTFPIIKKCRFH